MLWFVVHTPSKIHKLPFFVNLSIHQPIILHPNAGLKINLGNVQTGEMKCLFRWIQAAKMRLSCYGQVMTEKRVYRFMTGWSMG